MKEMITPAEAAGKEVKIWMTREGVTQKELANILGVTQASVSEKLRGKIAFNLNDLVTISAAFGISLGELLGDGILNAKVPVPALHGRFGDKKIAPIGFIPTGATYEVVGPAGLEPATKGL